MKNRVLFSLSILFFWACTQSADDPAVKEGKSLSDAELKFEVVDSLLVNYLGQLRFSDISPDGTKYLFHDLQRGNFLITDKAGETLHEFIKTGDRPDLPQFVADNPVFLKDDRIGLVGPYTAYVYDLDGVSIEIRKDEDTEKSRTINFTLPAKSLHPFRFGEQAFMLKSIQSGSLNEQSTGVDEKLENWRAIDFTDPFNGTFRPLIQLPLDTRFYDGAPYVSSMMRPIVNASKDKVYVSYVQDPKVYVYVFDGQDFIEQEQVDLKPDLFFFDEPKSSDDFELGIRPSGAGVVKFVYGYENHLYTQYNPGVKPEDRTPVEVTQYPGGGIGTRSMSPSNLPADRYQYFVDGFKQGRDFEKPDYLGEAVMGDGPYLWFTRNTRKDEEESDYVTFYKVRAVAKN